MAGAVPELVETNKKGNRPLTRRRNRWTWKDPIYGVHIEVIRGEHLEPFMRSLSKRAGWEVTDQELRDIDGAAGCAPFWYDAKSGKATLYLWFNSKRVDTQSEFGLSTIGHEAVHGALHVFDHIKATIGVEVHEPFAHYQTYLFTETMVRLRGQRG